MLNNRSVKLLTIYITLPIPLCNIFVKKEKYHEFQYNRAVANLFHNIIFTKNLCRFLMKSIVVDESLSATQLQFCSRENQLATIYKEYYITPLLGQNIFLCKQICFTYVLTHLYRWKLS